MSSEASSHRVRIAAAVAATTALICCRRQLVVVPLSPEEVALTSMMAAEEAERRCADTPGCKLLRFLHGHGLNHMCETALT